MTFRPSFVVLLPLVFMGATRVLPASAQNGMAGTRQEPLDADELSAALGGPTLLTLHFHEADPATVFAEIAKQINQPIRIDETRVTQWNGKRVTIDADHQPFWKVMEQLSHSIGFSWFHRLAQDGYIVSPSGNASRELRSMGVDVGMVRVVAMEARREQWIVGGFANPEEQGRENGDTLRLKFAVLPDPKLSIITDTAKFETLGTSTGTGIPPRPVERENRSGSIGIFAPAIWQLESDLRFYPSQTQKKLDFQGQLRFTAITRKTEWSLDNVLQTKEVSRDFPTSQGVVRVTFHGLLPDDRNPNLPKGRYTMNWSTKLVNGTNSRQEQKFLLAFKSYMAEKSRLTDEKGVSLAFNVSTMSSGEEESSLTFGRKRSNDGRDDAGDPVSYAVTVPLEAREVILPFELRDLPIPQFPDAGHPLP
ncbi:hypothetical protein IAD21_02807 [Abditibacteriota bacterium]|nr:hypothetical protein IAD21_02807 [Abditibacteriota bacterium]